MGKTLGYGEITVANMTEPFTVMLTNEAQQFATDSNRKVTSAQSYYTDIIVIRGSQERTDYTIGNITSGSGITVSKSSKRVTFSVSAGTTIGADTGVIEIPITLDGQTVKKQFSWSCGKQGPQGVKGEDGSNFAWNLLKGTGTAKEFTPKGNLTNQTTLFNKLDLSGQTLKEGDKFVISCDLEWTQFTQGTSGTFDYWFQGSVDYSWSYDNIFTQGLQKVQPTKAEILASDGKKHLSAVCTMKQSLLDKKIFEIGIRFDNTDGTGKIKISNLKIAKEDKESPWCLHPDELKGATGDKGKSVQSVIEYYLATSASTGVTTSTSGWSTDPTTQKLTAEKKYLWNCKQTVYDDGTRGSITSPVICGTYGDKGQNAKNLTITPSSQYFKSTDGGKTFAPNTITIRPTIQGEISFGKWQYSIDGGVSFADVVSGQKGLTISNNVLTVSKDSSLYSDAVTMVTFRAVASDSSFYDTCSIAKIYDVSDIGDGRNLLWNSNFAKTDEAITGTTNSWGLHTRGTNLVASIDTSTKHNGFNTLKTVSAANGDKNSSNDLEWFAWGISERTSDNLHSKNQNYTLSFYAKASVTTDFIVRWGYDAYGADTTRTLTTNWQKYEIKLHQATSAYSITIIFKLLTAGTVWFSEFKLEKGSSATGYSTAPEDLQTAILSTKSEISDVSLKVDKNKQAIEQRVEKTTYQQDLNLVKGDINKANEGLNKWKYEIYPKNLFASEYQGKSTMDVFAKNTNLTPSQSVLINDMDLSIAWNYDNNYIGYALTFAKFSAAKSVAITFAHDDGAHIYLNGKLIGGSDAYSQTGESLTLGFVKGWNCIEVVVNEGASTEGFKLGTTISAISECQLMNCYYGTPVARQSHITNQLVQNTTDIKGISTKVSKVTSVIGEGGENFTSFKNEYSDFKQTMNGFKTTVGQTYVTKDDFNGLEIGGRNLLLYSQTIRAHKDYYGVGWLTDEVETFNGCPVWSVKNQWGRLTWLFKSHVIDRGLVKVGDTLTYSLYAKTNNASGKSINCSYRFKGNANAYWFNGSAFNVGTNWTRYSVTFTITKDMLATDTYMTEIGFEETASMSGDDKVYYACPKLERGTKATDYTPALEDKEINGQNLVSNLSSNWEQGSVSYVANSTYASIKTVLATRLRTEDVFSVSGNVTISAGTSTNSSKEELNFYYVLFDVNKKAIGVPASGSEWQSLTSPKIINCGDAKYMAIILRWGSGSTVITPSNISQICLKIERGTSATPFTLAPEDVNGKIVNAETIANQTAKKFEWIVKGGDKSSSMVLTDDFLNIVANKINLKGKVTFESLSSDAKNEIGKVAQSKVDGIEVGGRNLLKCSSMIGEKLVCDNYFGCNNCDTKEYTNEGFHIITPTEGNANNGIAFSFDNFTILGINGGDTITFSCDIKGTSDSHIPFVSIHISDNNWYGSDVIQKHTWVSVTKDWQRISVTITTPTGLTKNHMWLAIHGHYQSDLYVRNFKLEKGNKPTDWTPAPEDYLPQANLVSNWTTNSTWIDGGKIYTGSITADKIAANAITSDKIATDAIKSRNYISSGGTQGSFLNLSDGSFTSPNLSWDSNGNLIATNANLSGEVTATKGTIGKYEITDQWLTTGSGSTCTGIGGNQAFWAGAEDSNSAPFRVGYDGKLTSSNADITGTITATNGKIGRYDITSTYLMTNSGSNASGIGGNQAFWAGAEDSNSAPFRVGYDGVLWAENAAIRGSIETGNLGDEGDTVSIINGHIGIQGTSNNVEIYSTGFKFGIDGDYYLMSVSEGVKCYRNLYATDFIADGWIYNASGGHYTWKDRDDAYISCGDYNGHNVYYYANYHAFYVNKDSGQGMMYINTNGVTSRVGFTKTSDERIKKNFESFDDNIIDAYMNIEPVKYQLKQSSNDNYHFGFKAQHVDKVFSDYGDIYNESFDICTSRPIDPDKAKELYGVDDMTEEYGLRYDELIAPTTYMVQHIYKELESTKGELAKVKQEKADLETRLQAIEAKLGL
jgi:hypothetical protein